MKVPAIVLAVVLSAASLCGQALVDYAGATAGSSTSGAGAAKGINPAAGLSNKMSAAMGETTGGSKAQSDGQTQVIVHPAEHSDMHSGAHSPMHCKEMKSDAQGMSGKHCKEMHGTEMHGTKAACCQKSKDSKKAGTGCCNQGKCGRMEAEKKS